MMASSWKRTIADTSSEEEKPCLMMASSRKRTIKQLEDTSSEEEKPSCPKLACRVCGQCVPSTIISLHEAACMQEKEDCQMHTDSDSENSEPESSSKDGNISDEVAVHSDDERYYLRRGIEKVMTVDEIILSGLERGDELEFEVINMEKKGRGVIAKNDIPARRFLCEYKTARTYHPKLVGKYEHEYTTNGEGSYILTNPSNPRLCFDATRRPIQIGRYINHSVTAKANCRPHRPLMVRGKFRVGFISTRFIKAGEEITYDYNVRDQEWMRSRSSQSTRGAEKDGSLTRKEEVDDIKDVLIEPGEEYKQLQMQESLEDSDAEEESEAAMPGLHKKGAKPAPHKGKGRLSRTDKRHYKICPIPKCRSKPQKKLSNHLTYSHKGLTTEQRLRYLNSAKIWRQPEKTLPPRKKLKGQLSIDHLFRPCDEEAESSSDGTHGYEVEDRGTSAGTRSFGRYDIYQDMSMVGFRRHLVSLDGKLKSEKVAKEIATDVSKFLRFACGSTATPDWSRLADRDQLRAFMDKVEKSGCGPAGKLGKLHSLECGLRYLRVDLLRDDTDHRLFQQASRASETIASWKVPLQKKKAKKRTQKLEELSTSKMSFDKVQENIRSPLLWEEFSRITDTIDCGREVPREELNMCTTMVATLLTLFSWQRPGAASNATMEEFNNMAEVRTRDGSVLKVLRVAEHKTGVSGSAKLLLTGADFSKLKDYVSVIRPEITGEQSTPYLLCLKGRDGKVKALTHFATRCSNLMQKFGLQPVTATTVRKLAATKAALSLEGRDSTLVTHQLSHTSNTDKRYYQAVSSVRDAAEAVVSMSAGQSNPSNAGQSRTEHADPPATSHPNPSTARQSKTSARRLYTREEEEVIESYFDSYIESGAIPTLLECRDFLQDHPLNRTSKNIQDKLKSYSRKKK